MLGLLSLSASSMVMMPLSGPTASSLTGLTASIALTESGLILEVADSLVAPGELGLFVRCEHGPVALDGPSPFCGYADGSMQSDADSTCGKTVTFALHSPSTRVFFEGRLLSVQELLQRGFAIAGYLPLQDASGALTGIERDAAYTGPLHFVPSPTQGSYTIMNVGQMANDLAISAERLAQAGSEEALGRSYTEDSRDANILALVQRLERDAPESMQLIPSRPISTLARDVIIDSTQPVEVGCQYGAGYWGMR